MLNVKNNYFQLIVILSLLFLLFNFTFTVKSEDKYDQNFISIKNSFIGKDQKFTNEPLIKIIIQDEVEESHEVSMVVKIPNNLKDTKKIYILVDNNPIQLVTKIFPEKPIKTVGFNIRMEQDSYVRAAILNSEGIWNISSKKVIVKSPGGCSLPACDPTKQVCEESELGKIVMNKYKRSSGDWRLKFKINHPMDTGLVSNPESGELVPEYYINWVYFKDSNGALAKAQTFGALSANPTLILDFYENILDPNVKVTDSKGNEFSTISEEEYSL
jgi:sulfur-oxidizing protein SoxY